MALINKLPFQWLYKGALVVLLIFSISIFSSSPTYAQVNPQNQGTTCAVEKVGWIVCPVIEGASRAADQLYNYLAEYFLEVPPELINNADKNPTRLVWEQTRNLANVAFIIAFIVLIYSQITGGVMSNYGIKRMLPRLIIAAVAVNISYYICQGMVDLSNILGYNVKGMLDRMVLDLDLPQVLGQEASQAGTTNTQTSNGGAGTGVTAIATVALAAGGVVWALIGILTGSIGVTLGVILYVVLVLILRKALVVLFVVVSPLAFVAYILPNTEKFFKQWYSTFWQLLLLFPVIALILGGGKLAGGIILAAGIAQTKVSSTSITPLNSRQVAIDTPSNVQDNLVQRANITLSSDIAARPAVAQPGEFAQIKLAQTGLAPGDTCTGAVTSITGQPCGDVYETGRGPASLGFGISALVAQVGVIAVAVTRIRELFKRMGGAFSDMGNRIEGVSQGIGKGTGAVTSGTAKFAGKTSAGLFKKTKFGAAVTFARQQRKANSERSYALKAAAGLTGSEGKLAAWVGGEKGPGSSKKRSWTRAGGAETAHHGLEKAIKDREALETHGLEHFDNNDQNARDVGESEHHYLGRRYQQAIENNDTEGMMAYQNMLANRGRDGQRAMRTALQNTTAHHDSHQFQESMQHFARTRTDTMGSAADLYMYSYYRGNGENRLNGGALTMDAVRNDVNTYASLDDNTMAGQDWGEINDDHGNFTTGESTAVASIMNRAAYMVDPHTGERIKTNLAGKIRASNDLSQRVRADTMREVERIANSRTDSAGGAIPTRGVK